MKKKAQIIAVMLLLAVATGCQTQTDQTSTAVVANATHDGEYPDSNIVKILPGNDLAGIDALQSEIASPTTSVFPSGTATLVLYVEFPLGTDSGNDTLSYSLYRGDSLVLGPVIFASKSYKGQPSTIWGIRKDDYTVHLTPAGSFRNISENIEFASTPHTAAIAQGMTRGICVRTVVKSGDLAFPAGSYRIDISWDKTVIRSLSFVVN